MKELVKVASIHDIQPEEVKGFEIADKQIAIANIGNEYFAFDEICSHEYSSLAEGWLEDDHTIECPMHGAQFDIRTGEALSLPAVEGIKTYEVIIKDEEIFVRLDEDNE